MDTFSRTVPSSRIKLLISYDGTDYAGWQKQAEGDEFTGGRPTIQSTLEAALSKIFDTPIRTVASGRTDAGVHAEGQVVHFDAPRAIGDTKLVRALNKMTPPTLGILKAWSAPSDFHALFSAKGKTYRYVIHNSREPNPLTARFMTHFEKPLDIDRLNALAEPLVGEHDFKSFQTSGTEVKTTVRTIREARWLKSSDGTIEFRITGTGFLKQMVRNIVGTLLYLHQNDGNPADMKRILQSLDRQAAKTTAPPEGLHLHAVYYPPELDNECREL
jgi:tRNA pseudouridine38-40 synthase